MNVCQCMCVFTAICKKIFFRENSLFLFFTHTPKLLRLAIVHLEMDSVRQPPEIRFNTLLNQFSQPKNRRQFQVAINIIITSISSEMNKASIRTKELSYFPNHFRSLPIIRFNRQPPTSNGYNG